MDTVSVPFWPPAYKEAVCRRLAFSPSLSRPISRPLAVSPLPNPWHTESESPTRSLAEAIPMLYDRILHFVLSQLDPLALDAELRLWCTQGMTNGDEGLVMHIRSCIFGDKIVSDETRLLYSSHAALVEAEGPEVTWYWQAASPETLAALVQTLSEALVHRHLMPLAESAYPDLPEGADRFTPAEHPEEWFAALLRDIFRRQRHVSC